MIHLLNNWGLIDYPSCQKYPFVHIRRGRAGGGKGGQGRDEAWDLETMFSQLAKRSPCVNIFEIEARSEPACIFVFLAYRICRLVLKLQGKLKCKTNNNALDRFMGYIVFAGQRLQRL